MDRSIRLLVLPLLLVFGCVGAGSEGVASGGDTEAAAGDAAGTEANRVWSRVRPGGETTCALGTEFSFFVRTASEDKLLVYLQGGGACWDARTCDPDGDPTYSLDVDERDDPASRPVGIFDLDNSDNPLRDYSMVMVPYCTGDVHIGDRVTTYTVQEEDGGNREVTIHHRGYVNVMAALGWVADNVPEPAEIVVAGSSAGSIPSPFYAGVLAGRVPDARITALGDASGAYRRDPERESDPTRSWATLEVLQRHPGHDHLTANDLGFEDLYVAAGTTHPDIRLLQFDAAFDAVQGYFLDLAYEDVSGLPELIEANREEIRAAVPGFRSFLAGGPEHTILWRPAFYSYEVGGTRFRDWLAKAVSGEPLEDVACEDCGRPQVHLTETDARIVARARELLDEEADWSPRDDGPCDLDASGSRSLRCALLRATMDVLGVSSADTAAMIEARFQARDRLTVPLEGRADPLRVFNEETDYQGVLDLLDTVAGVAEAHTHG